MDKSSKYIANKIWIQYSPVSNPISNMKQLRQMLASFYLHRLFLEPISQ